MQHWDHALKDTEPSIDQAQRVKGFLLYGPSIRPRVKGVLPHHQPGPESKVFYLMVHQPGPESMVFYLMVHRPGPESKGFYLMVHRPGPESQRASPSSLTRPGESKGFYYIIDQAQSVKGFLPHGPSTRPRGSKSLYLNISQAQRVKRVLYLMVHRPGPESQRVSTSCGVTVQRNVPLEINL